MELAVAPVELSISARALHDNLAHIVDEIDRLRLVQQLERPVSKPPWWNEHIHSTDLEWPAHRRRNCRPDRMAFRHRRTEMVVVQLIGIYTRLLDGIDIAQPHRAVLNDALNSLYAMNSMLSGAQPCARLYWAVIPDQVQLNRSIPAVYTPVLPTAHEQWIQEEISSVCYRFARLGEGDLDTTRRQVRILSRRAERLRARRVAANRRLLLTMVTQEQHDRIVSLFADWREIVKRWELAERCVRRAIQLLSSGEPAADSFLSLQVSHAPDLAVTLRQIVRAAVDEAARTVRVEPPQGRSCSCEHSAMYRIAMEGSYWVLVFDGRRTILRSGPGMVCLRRLVQFPNKRVDFRDLAKEATPPEVIVECGNTPRFDQKAAAEYQSRLRDLDEEIDDAQRDADSARTERLETERAEMIAELKAGFRRGEIRTGSVEYRNLRNRICNAVNRAVAEIASDNPLAGEHFREALRTDHGMIYDPKASFPWEF
jgi:hypothetical protein